MRSTVKKIMAVLVSSAMLLTALSGCGSKPSQSESAAASGDSGAAVSAETADSGDTGDAQGAAETATGQVDHLTMALRGTTFDPAPFTPSNPGLVIKNMLYATLVYRPSVDASLEECQMWLAKSVTKTEDKTYAIELYDNIVDSKGNAITADDVIWSYQTSRDVAQFVDASYIAELTKVDDYNLVMKVTSDVPGIIETLLSNSLLYIVDQEWYESASEDERRTDPAVTGTYRPTNYVPGSALTVEAIGDYWQKDPALLPSPALQNVKTVDFKVITEASMRAIALENGEVDISEISTPDLGRFYDLEAGEALEGWNFGTSPQTMIMSAFLNMDPGKSPLADDINLRKALLYAINAEDCLFGNGYELATAAIPKAFGYTAAAGSLPEWSDPNTDYFNYNMDKAKEYFKASGYKEGEVTLRVMTSMSLVTDGFRSVLFANLEEVGFKVDSLAVDQALYNTYKNDSSQWDVMIDLKTSLAGHITGLWTSCYDPKAFSNGSVNFIHDDKLTELLYTSLEKADEDSIRAFSEYLNELAAVKSLYCYGFLFVAQDGILEMKGIQTGNTLLPQAFVYASDYQSVA